MMKNGIVGGGEFFLKSRVCSELVKSEVNK
jgi:hypothetical protein